MAENEAKQAPLQAWTGVQSILSGFDQRILAASSLGYMRIFDDIEAQNNSFATSVARSMNGIGQIGESLTTALDSFAARAINVTSVFESIEAQNKALFATMEPQRSLIEASIAPLLSRADLYKSLGTFDAMDAALARFRNEPFAPPSVDRTPATPRPAPQLPLPAPAHATPHETILLTQLENAVAAGALSPQDVLQRITRYLEAPKRGPKEDVWTAEQACAMWSEWQQVNKRVSSDRFARDRNISKATMYRIFERFGLKRT